jgi:integrase
MASITKRPNGQWRARYRDLAGREHARHFARKLDAERWLASVKTSLARGEWVDPALARVTVGDWAARWLADQVQLKPSTRFRYASLLRNQILPVWERVPLSAVTHADVGEWVRRMSEAGLSPATVRQAHRVFSLLIGLAIRDGRLPRNVTAEVRLPRAGRAEKVFLTHAQVAELARAAGPHGLIVLVLAYTGLRWGELAALRVKRVDLVRRRLVVAESVTEANVRRCSARRRRTTAGPSRCPGSWSTRSRIGSLGGIATTWCSPRPRGACCVTTTSGGGCSTGRHGRRGWPA